MRNVLTADDNCNYNFYQDEAHRIEGDKHRQEVVFDKGGIATGLPKTATSPIINPHARQRQRNRLNRLTAVFLRDGVKVTVCPPGDPPNFRFGKFKSPSPSRGMTSTSDLSRRRWCGPTLDARTERDLIRRAKSGDEQAKQKLFESFHRFVLSIVSKRSGPPHNDLMSAGLMGFWEAVRRFNENHGRRLSTYSRHWVEKYVRLCIKDWRKEGASGETRQDRYIFSNPHATAEQVVAAVGGKLKDAEQAIARLDAGHESYDTNEAAFDEDGHYTGPQVAAAHEMARAFGCFSQFQLSPQLVVFEPTSKWIDELAQHHIADKRQRLNEVGYRQYADEVVARERVWISFRSKESRYRYRTATDINDRAKIAARFNTLIFFERPPNKPATSTIQQYELDAQILREKNARLKALRLAQPLPIKQSKRKRKDKWRNTQVTTPAAKSLRLRCPHLPQKQQENVCEREFFTLSHLCRTALFNDLRARGFDCNDFSRGIAPGTGREDLPR